MSFVDKNMRERERERERERVYMLVNENIKMYPLKDRCSFILHNKKDIHVYIYFPFGA